MALAVLLALLTACDSPRSPTRSSTATSSGTALPTTLGRLEVVAQEKHPCPHDSVPPTPQCGPRPIEGVDVVIRRAGREVARGATDRAGRVGFELPPGEHEVAGQPRDGFRITPAPVGAVVHSRETTAVELNYNTGNQ